MISFFVALSRGIVTPFSSEMEASSVPFIEEEHGFAVTRIRNSVTNAKDYSSPTLKIGILLSRGFWIELMKMHRRLCNH